jgi:hypothetical protein
MATLKELAASLRPKTKTLEFGGQSMDIRGVSAGEIADICERFPEFSDFLNAAREGATGESVDSVGLLTPEAVERIGAKMDVGKALALGRGAYPAIIAAACDQPGDAETESIAGSFAFEFQQLMVAEILKLSFPQAAPLANAGVQS